MTTTATEPLLSHDSGGDGAEAPALKPGVELDGRYVIEHPLGVGSAGRVYAALYRKRNRRVAIKIARRRADNPGLIREGLIMATFRHPGLPALHTVGEHAGQTYLVMEYLRGPTLADYLREYGPLDMAETLRILSALCASLYQLHRAGRAHRDLRPDNIILTDDGRVVLIDFGLCDPKRPIPSQEIAGSAHYMAPEIALDALQAGGVHLADLYALGVLGFAMLSGHTPYAGRTIVEVLAQQVVSPAPSLTQMGIDAPQPLVELIADLLACEPDARPSSITFVAEQLARLAQDSADARVPTSGPLSVTRDLPILAASHAHPVNRRRRPVRPLQSHH